jgi:hypothetical protein
MRLLILLSLLLAAPAGTLPAQISQYLPEILEHQNRHNVLIVLATNRNDDRVFDVHLDLSVRWDAMERREIYPIDILPPRRDATALAGVLGVEGESFALVLINRQGEIIYRGTDPRGITEIFRLLDLEERE